MSVNERIQPNIGNHSKRENEILPISYLNDFTLLERLQALTSANLIVSSELDLDTVLQRIADTARQFANAAYAAVGILDEYGSITSFITSGISKEEREKIGELPHGHGLLGVLIRQGKALRVGDMSKDPRRSGFPPNHPLMTSLLGVPISLQDQVIGDLYLTDKFGFDEFSAADEWWLTLFARQAAVAVQNAHHYKRVQISHQRAQTLAELAGTLNQSIDPEELFQQITQASCRLLELPASALYLLDSGGTHFEMQSQYGLQESLNPHRLMSLDGSIAGKVLANGIPVAVSDTSALQEVLLQPLHNGRTPRSLLVVPIRCHDQVSGVIEVYSAQPREFSGEEVSLLEAFGGQAALALEKAQLYKHKEEFLSMTAHDLRAPLASIMMSAGLLAAHLPAGLPPTLTRLVNNISCNSERLNNLLNDLLDLTRLEQGKVRLHLECLEIGEAVAATAHTLIPLFEEKAQKLEFDKPLREYWVMADRRRFEQALVNLIANSNKYTPIAGTVKISLQVTGNWVTIRIKDSGPGIPLEEQNRIFDRYYRQTVHEQNSEATGTGLGLPIARYLIELHGGQIWVESEVGYGSTFFIKLPLQTSLQSM